MTASRSSTRVSARAKAAPGQKDPAGRCACRCDWCRDRRYYLAAHLPMPAPLDLRPRDPQEETRWHEGKECPNRWPCRCHCPACHHREAHYVHFHLFRLNWDCPDQAQDFAARGMHSHSERCQAIPWVPTDGKTKQPTPQSRAAEARAREQARLTDVARHNAEVDRANHRLIFWLAIGVAAGLLLPGVGPYVFAFCAFMAFFAQEKP